MRRTIDNKEEARVFLTEGIEVNIYSEVGILASVELVGVTYRIYSYRTGQAVYDLELDYILTCLDVLLGMGYIITWTNSSYLYGGTEEAIQTIARRNTKRRHYKEYAL